MAKVAVKKNYDIVKAVLQWKPHIVSLVSDLAAVFLALNDAHDGLLFGPLRFHMAFSSGLCAV